MHQTDEEALVTRAKHDDSDAVAQLYDRHHEQIFRYLLVRVNHQQVAEDLTGEVFARMVAGLPDYRNRHVPFQAWLFRIARNLLIDHYRKEGQYTMTSLEQVESRISKPSNLESSVEYTLTLERIQEALVDIDEIQREVIVLRFLIGLSLKEAAQVVNKSVAAVKAIQHRGLMALRVALDREE